MSTAFACVPRACPRRGLACPTVPRARVRLRPGTHPQPPCTQCDCCWGVVGFCCLFLPPSPWRITWSKREESTYPNLCFVPAKHPPGNKIASVIAARRGWVSSSDSLAGRGGGEMVPLCQGQGLQRRRPLENGGPGDPWRSSGLEEMRSIVGKKRNANTAGDFRGVLHS